jgi:hypothetical protein
MQDFPSDTGDTTRSVYHVYTCGHSTLESGEFQDHSKTEYVFVESPCSDQECSSTDPSHFTHDPSNTTPGPTELVEYERLHSKLHLAKQTLNEATQRFEQDLAPDFTRSEIESVPDPFAASFLLMKPQERKDATNCLLPFTEIRKVLQYAKSFGKDRRQRPYFDFCLKQAESLLTMMHEPIQAIKDAVDYLDLADYQPQFGRFQLNTLRQAGAVGSAILSKPTSKPMLEASELFIADLHNGAFGT